MQPRARDLVEEQLLRWREAGLLDETTFARLHATLDDPSLDRPAEERATRAASGLQLVGGLLLGAAFIALALALDLTNPSGGWMILALGGACAGGAFFLDRSRPGRGGFADAGYAAACVAAGAAGIFQEGATTIGPLAATGMLLVLLVLVARRATTPIAATATAAFIFGSVLTVRVENLLGGNAMAASWIWLALLLGWGLLLFALSRNTWVSVSLGVLVFPFAFGIARLLGTLGIEEIRAVQLIVGAILLALVVLGILLAERGLATGAAAALTIDAILFAEEVGGAVTALVVLALLAGALIWQAELLKTFYRRKRPQG